MPGLSIRVDVDSELVQRALRELDGRARNLTPAFDALGLRMVDGVRRRMEAGVDPTGKRWAPLSETTLKIRRLRGWGAMPLIRSGSGQLFSSWSHRAGPDFLEVGNSRVYAGTMHFGAAKGAFGRMSNGSPIPWGNIPGRGLLAAPTDDEVEDSLLPHLRGGRAN